MGSVVGSVQSVQSGLSARALTGADIDSAVLDEDAAAVIAEPHHEIKAPLEFRKSKHPQIIMRS